MKQRAPALPDSPTFQQFWDALGSRLIETAQGDLLYTGVSQVRDMHGLRSASLPSASKMLAEGSDKVFLIFPHII